MRVLVVGAPLLALADLLAQKGVEVQTHLPPRAACEQGFAMPPSAWTVHRDQPSPGRSNVIPANLVRRPKR